MQRHMPVREARDRRGRAARGSAGLLERDSALQAIDSALRSTGSGIAQALLIEGHAGMGKSRLHEAALDSARARDLVVIRAAGADLEQNIAFGVVRQLLSESPDPGLMRHQELFTALTAAVQSRPALIAIDDLHWCDPHSLEFVAYMLHRLEELRCALVMTTRPAAGSGAMSAVFDRVAGHPQVRLVRLRPLGRDAIGELARETLGERADAEVVDACEHATRGNPFFLHELLLALRDESGLNSEGLARRARSLAPDAVTRSLRVRVGRLGSMAGALAQAVAVLGDDVELRHAAALAGVRTREAASAADALASVEVLLAREPLRFVHPLVRRAVERDIPASELANRHLDAARLLYADGADAEQIAAHLLQGRAEGDAWAVDQLLSAAGRARSRAAARSAISYLQRALDEPAPPDRRPLVLAELGAAEAAVAAPRAAEHLAAAVAVIEDPERRAELALLRGDALRAKDLYEQAAAAYDGGLRALADEAGAGAREELREVLQTSYVAMAWSVLGLQSEALRRSPPPPAELPSVPATPAERLRLVRASLRAAFAGERAETVAALAEAAWGEGLLLASELAGRVGTNAWAAVLACYSLIGEYERCLQVADAVLGDARDGGEPAASCTAATIRALGALRRAHVSDALDDLELAGEAESRGWLQLARVSAANRALCMIETGDYVAAERALSAQAPLTEPRDLPELRRRHALAELRLAQGQPADALRLATRAGALLEGKITVIDHCPWRTTAAQAALALGDRERARALAGEALSLAERTRVPDARIRAMRVLGLCEGGERGLELLAAGAEVAAATPPRLEALRLLVDLGAALRRANQRAAAREPLQRAADLAAAGGAASLHERARTELAATGSRPRRELLLGGRASLTPSELRIAQLAVRGQTNREISQTLFVTPKTVEYHLRNVYRKLDIAGRGELKGVLGP